jgi:dihydrofolate synthase/folylpolyglutamate synthase
MNYRQCLDYLYDLQKFGIKLGLVNTVSLLNYLGNPHFKYPTIHIAGSNGKGSVCAMLESILCSAGYQAGLYTSPHLVSFTERIRICRKEIEPEFITEFVNQLKARIDRDQYTFFEVTTALAFLYFAEKKVEFAVVETGLGGRLDSTNLVQPEVAGITTISLEHTDILGKTLKKIAWEKGGIVKENIPTVVGNSEPLVVKTLKQICKQRKSRFVSVADTSRWRIKDIGLKGGQFDAKINGRRYSNLFVNLAGRHQVGNAVFALKVVEQLKEKGWHVSDGAVKQGLRAVFWPARFEIREKRPLTILDAAHNPAGTRVLVDTFQDLLPGKKINILFGVMADKDYALMLKIMSSIAKKIVLVSPKIERAAKTSDLGEIVKKLGIEYNVTGSVKSGYSLLLSQSSQDDVICVSGSHYTIGELLS